MWSELLLLASMGPQLLRCGNYPNAHGIAALRICFNGAAAITLRKFTGYLAWDRAGTSFNGAAAITLRKFTWLGIELELGGGFNGAAAITLRK